MFNRNQKIIRYIIKSDNQVHHSMNNHVTPIKKIYLSLALIGFILPYSQFLPWLFANGLDLTLFFNELWVNAISRFFALDVIASAFTLFCFIFMKQNALQFLGFGLPS